MTVIERRSAAVRGRTTGTGALLLVPTFATMAALSACTVPGMGQRGPLDLDTGVYSAERLARPPLTDAGKRQVAGIRVGEQMMLRTEVDGELTESALKNYPLASPVNLDSLEYFTDVNLLETDKPTKTASELPSSDKFRYGFVMTGSNPGLQDEPDSKFLQYAVLYYEDDRAAETALKELADAVRINLDAFRPVDGEVSGLPAGAESVTASDETGESSAALARRGRALVFASGLSRVEGWPARIARAAVERQLAAMPDEAGLEDPLTAEAEELLSRTLPITDTEDRYGIEDNVAGPRVAAQRYLAVQEISELFAETGVDAVATRETELIRTADPTRAEDFRDGYLQLVKETGGKTVASPRDLPSAHCLDGGGESFTCVVAVDRYVAVATGTGLLDVQRQISAQYLLLKD